MGELVDSLKKSHDTAVGPDDIHYQILKHLPECTLDTLLNIYSQIWDGETSQPSGASPDGSAV